MESSSRRAAFEPRPHQGASWPSTAGFTSSSRLWLLRRRAARGEFGPHSRRPEKKLLHPTPPAAVPIPVCLEISPFWPRHSSRPCLDRLSMPSSCTLCTSHKPLRSGKDDGSRCQAVARTPEAHPSTYPTTPNTRIHMPCPISSPALLYTQQGD